MNKHENQGILAILIGIIFLLISMILSAMFAEKIAYGGYIFTVTSLSSLILMFFGIKKTIQHTISKR